VAYIFLVESIGFGGDFGGTWAEKPLSMVLYFTPIGAEPGKNDWKIYMGRDKYENEDLIKYGLPHDVW